jgi:hypothetical protein
MNDQKKECGRAKLVCFGYALFLFGLLMHIALLDFDPKQSVLISTKALDAQSHRNLIGEFGSWFAFWTIRFIGFASFSIPVLLMWFSLVTVLNLQRVLSRWLRIYEFCAILAMTGLFSAMHRHLFGGKVFTGFFDNKFSPRLGGIFGLEIFNGFLGKRIGLLGGFIVLLAIFLASMWLIFRRIGPVAIEKKTAGCRPQLGVDCIGCNVLYLVYCVNVIAFSGF